MRTALIIALLALTAAAAHAQPAPATPPAAPPDTGITVNMGALPTQPPPAPPMPRHKPSAEEMRALLVPMPRHKPDPAALAEATPAPDASTAAPDVAAAPTAAVPPSTVAATSLPFPRPKPQLAQTEAVQAEAKPHKPPQVGTEASPAPPVPMISPQGATDIASALRGTSSAAPTVDPTIGFAVLTRVRFKSGDSALGDDAKAALDTLAARLLANEERVRLAAFSGAPGDTSSEARRLSLERALAVRTYLASKGVPAFRVDLLVFGGSSSGVTDRVDVLIRAT